MATLTTKHLDYLMIISIHHFGKPKFESLGGLFLYGVSENGGGICVILKNT